MGRLSFDLAIVGGGIVGLASALQILRAKPRTSLVILEKESDVALHQSSHNTGVVHAGIYYRPGSLKARLCREGKEALERFAEERSIPILRSGKLIVASSPDELGRLADLRERAIANGVPGIEEIGPERMREIEPHLTGVRALYSPTTGSIDFHAVARAYAAEVRARGGTILTGHAVVGFQRMSAGWRIEARVVSTAVPSATPPTFPSPRSDSARESSRAAATDTTAIEARAVITCAGLHSDRVAAMTAGHAGEYRIVPFRGDYYMLGERARPFVHGHIHPVPDPEFPFLGVHLSRRIDGQVLAGPNAVLAFAREGYRLRDVSARDLAETLAFRGFRRLLVRYAGTGLRELWRDISKATFLASLRRFLPELSAADLLPGPSGVRAQSVSSGGQLLDDFLIEEAAGVIHVRNAPSPAATASLAIGRVVRDLALSRFGLK